MMAMLDLIDDGGELLLLRILRLRRVPKIVAILSARPVATRGKLHRPRCVAASAPVEYALVVSR